MNNDREDIHALQARVDRFQDRHAVIITEDNQTLLFSRSLLPVDITEGATVWISVQTQAVREQDQKKMAKALLNEILNPEP